jgi:hypothetical protein
MTSLEQARDRALRTNLEAIVTFPAGLGLTTATPLQRAICRIATGQPLRELAEHPDVLEAVGRVDLLWGEQPKEVYLLAPSRTGKSTIVAGHALRASQTVDLGPLAGVPGEPPRYPIISIDKDKARAIFGTLEKALQGPFAHLAMKEPAGGKALVRHPSGQPLEIVVAAGRAEGGAVISRWLFGLALDEATRMAGDERQISVTKTRSASLDRLLPGAQIVYLGSKWAPYGYVYEQSKRHGGRPSRKKSTVVIGWSGAEAHKLNPILYTPRLYEELKEADDGSGAYLVARNEWQSPPRNMFDLGYLQRLSRPAPRCDCDARQLAGLPSAAGEPACPHGDSPPHPRQHYVACIDPATRGNAWALVALTVRELAAMEQHGTTAELRGASCEGISRGIRGAGAEVRLSDAGRVGEALEGCAHAEPSTHDRHSSALAESWRDQISQRAVAGYRDDIALCRQWQGSSAAPLDPDAVFAEIAELLRPYRCNRIYTDPWSADALRTIARQHGLYLVEVLGPTGKALSMADKVESFDAIGTALAMNERGHHDRRSLELHPCTALLGDLSRVVRRPTLAGVVVELPLTPDGRHCDFAAALALGYTQVLQRPDAVSVHETADERDERRERETLRRRAAEQERARRGDEGQGYEELRYE